MMVNWEFADSSPAKASDILDQLAAGREVRSTRGATIVAEAERPGRFDDGRADDNRRVRRPWWMKIADRSGPLRSRRATRMMTPCFVLTANWGDKAPMMKIAEYEAQGGYDALRKTLTMTQDEVMNAVQGLPAFADAAAPASRRA